MRMNPESIHGAISSAARDQAAFLTEEQRNIAEVVGHALAAAWRRKMQTRAEESGSSSQPDTSVSTNDESSTLSGIPRAGGERDV